MGLRIAVFLVGLIGLISAPKLLVAEEKGDLFTLPLEELTSMDYIVQTASKRDERISDAPAIMTVVTAGDIARFGAVKLSDVLARFPNVYMWGSEILRNNVASIRGGTPTHADNHVLVLLNGRPMRDSLIGENLHMYDSFPLAVIERIEMVRGPGSVLYGSNAFSGVINIITKSARDIPKNQVSVGGGSFATRKLSALGAIEIKDSSTIAAVNGLDSDGWNIPFIDQTGVKGGFEHGEKSYSGMLHSRYKNLTLSAYAADSTTNFIGPTVRFPPVPRRRQRHFLDAGYRFELSENWTASLNGTLNDFFDQTVGTLAEGRLLEMGVSGEVWKKLQLTTGAVINNNYAEMINPMQSLYNDVTWYGVYAQLDYPLTEWLKLTGGFQLNKPEDIPYNIVPRLGMVMNFTPAWGAKLLYGEAFRSPYAAETTLNLGFLIGNRKLEPETVSTVDAQIFYNEGGYSSALTAYQSRQKKVITRINTVPINFINGGSIDYWGLEWEGRAQVIEHWELHGSASYQAGEDEQGNKDVGFVPHYMAKVGLSYSSGTGYQVGLFNAYYSDAAKIEKISAAAVVNPSAESYHWLTVNASFDLQKLIGSPLILTFYGENMLDEAVYFPETFSRGINTTPMRSGRAGYATVTVKF